MTAHVSYAEWRIPPELAELVTAANSFAEATHHRYPGTVHLLQAILNRQQGTAYALLATHCRSIEQLRIDAESMSHSSATGRSSKQGERAPQVKSVLARTMQLAIARQRPAEAVHLLAAILQEPDCAAARVLARHAITWESIRAALDE